MRRLIGLASALFAVAILLFLCTVGVCAESEAVVSVPSEEWELFGDSVPDEVIERLPEGALAGEDGLSESVTQMSRGDYLAEVVLDILGVELGSTLKLFFALCALILLSSVFSAFSEGLDNTSLASAVRFCSVGALISVVLYTQYSHFEMLETLFSKLNTMMSGMVPVVASIWAMGGNVGTASVGSASFGVILTVSETLCSSTVIPVCCALTVFGFCDSLTDEIKTARVANAIKKIYVFGLGLVMTVLLSSLGAQTALAASADTTAARTARLVSGTVIPVVGGSVGETFRTVAAGVGHLKNVFGIGSIIMIAILVLPTVISILLTRLVFLLCGGLADMLGCPNEAKTLEKLGEVYGFMLGVVSSVAAMFIIGLYIFMQTVVAVA